jgi:hypothetical protein
MAQDYFAARQEDLYRGALADARYNPDASARLLGKPKHLRQSEPRIFSRLFRGEERFEDVGKYVIRNTNTGIVDGQTNILPWSRPFRTSRPALDDGIERFKRQNATRLHGVSGVALAIGFAPLWFGLEPGRKLLLPLGLLFMYTNNHAEARKNCIQKIKGPSGRREIWQHDPCTLRN